MHKFISTKITILISLVLLAGCGIETEEPIQEKAFPEKNIAKHTFKFESDKLRDTIISLFSLDNQYKNPILNEIFFDAFFKDKSRPCTFNVETSKDTIFSQEYFARPNTSNDIFLHTLGTIWLSKYYYSKNHPLEFFSNYAIKFEKINDSMTKVWIVADNPQVINGTECCGPHGFYSRYTPVQPTSIEEYTLLEFIASKLGDTTLAPIKLPVD